jgi:AraC-like DNA-binding protein
LTGEFKKTFGLSLIDYLIKVRISHARELLGNVNLPISHIAESCGYEDGAYFSKLFKKQTGFSPTEYRRRNE